MASVLPRATSAVRRHPAASAIGVLVVLVALAAGIAWAIGVGKGSGGALDAPHFVDETATAGISHTYGGDDTFNIGGGVAVFDCDADGRPDIYAAGGAGPAALYRDDSATGGPLHFAQLESPATDLSNVTGAYPLDIDGDGVTDLAMLRIGGPTLLRGLGDCQFAPADTTWGFSGVAGTTTAFSATWEGKNAMPTLAFGNYVESEASGGYRCPDNQAYRPSAVGTSYGLPIALSPGFCPLSMLFSDWDGSGRRDLRVSNDRQYYDNEVGGEQLWRFDPGSAPRAYTAADGWQLLRLWGMGIADYDVSGDGLPDYFLTSQGANTLQTLTNGSAHPSFHDMALKREIVATRPVVGGDPLPSTAWHPEFQDVNNDGLIDLLVTKGNVNAQPDFAQKDPNNLFLGQSDGSFVERSDVAGIVSYDKGRGAALADFNADGLLDLVVVNLNTPVRIWRNVGGGSADRPSQMGHWIGVRLDEQGANRDAVGAIVETRVGDQVARREIVVGGGHLGGQSGWTHAGLGSAKNAEVRVTWPDGTVGAWTALAADHYYTITRDSPAPVEWSPPS